MMDYRRLGRWGLRVSALGLGCSNFGADKASLGAVDAAGADAMVRAALDSGVNLFDTAGYYAEGRSEETLGRALKGRRHEALISTRVVGTEGGGPDDTGLSRAHILRAAERSLKRLGTDFIDLFQVQDLGQTVPPGEQPPPVEEALRALEDLTRQGKVRYAGGSDFGTWQLAEAVGAAERRDWSPFCFNQIHYSLVRREAELSMLPYCRHKGLGALVWSPLAAGYLTGKYRRGKPAPAGSRRTDPTVQFPAFDEERGERVLAALDRVAARKGCPVATAALAWTLSKSGVTSLVLGARDAAQLKANLGAAALRLDPVEAGLLDRASRPAWFAELAGDEAPERQAVAA